MGNGQGRLVSHHETTVGSYHNELTKLPWQHRHCTQVIKSWILGRKACAGNNHAVWVSKTLPIDLNLPMNKQQPACVTVQLLLIADGLPVILMTLFDSTLQTPRKNAYDYTVYVAQELKRSLANFCACDYLLIRLTMNQENVTEESLEKAYTEEFEDSRRTYGGPQALNCVSFAELKNAVTTLSGVSPVPSLLHDGESSEEGWLLLLDKPWRAVMHRLIEALSQGEDTFRVTYLKPQAEFKMKVALLEASRRFSLSKDVMLVAPDTSVLECIERIREQTRKELKMKSRLKGVKPAKTLRKTNSSYVIYFDCPGPSTSVKDDLGEADEVLNSEAVRTRHRQPKRKPGKKEKCAPDVGNKSLRRPMKASRGVSERLQQQRQEFVQQSIRHFAHHASLAHSTAESTGLVTIHKKSLHAEHSGTTSKKPDCVRRIRFP